MMDTSVAPAPSLADALRPVLSCAYRVAEHLTGSPSEAEACLADAAMQTFRIRADCLDGRGVRPWFLRAVLQGCGTRYRRRHPTLALTALDRWDELPLYEATQAGQPDEEAAEAASRFFAEVAPRDVEASLASLPYEYREVAALYFMAGCSYPELSIVLDLSVDAVRPRLHAARRALQRALRDRARERGLLPAA